MCNLSLLQTRKMKALSAVSFSCSMVARSRLSPSVSESEGRVRRRWTTGELTEILDALMTLRTDDIARKLGVNPKALRSVLRRNGISLRVTSGARKRRSLQKAASSCGGPRLALPRPTGRRRSKIYRTMHAGGLSETRLIRISHFVERRWLAGLPIAPLILGKLSSVGIANEKDGHGRTF